METYKVSSIKEMERFKDEYGYKVDGNLEVNCSLDFTGRLLVEGYLSTKAGEYIKAGWYIKAGESIKAGWYIKAGGYIEAGRSIKAGGYIEAGGSIKAGWYIKAGGSIEAGEYIKAGGYIKAGRSIEAGEYIEAGGSYGISAGLQITCKDKLVYGLKCFAGMCIWKKISDEEKTITCGKHEGGVIEYGILKETGIEKTPEEMIEIDGNKVSKSTIKEALKQFMDKL